MKEKKPMIKKLGALLIAAALGAALILSCSPLFEAPVEAAGGSGETGRVVLSVSPGGAAPARTVLPTAALDFSRYELVFRTTDYGIPVSDTAGIDGAGVSMELAVGTWTATVIAYRKFTVTGGTEQEYKAAWGESPITVAPGEITPVTVSLAPLPVEDTTVKGIFTYKVIFPDDAEAALRFGDEASITIGSGTEVSVEKDPGYYDLFITATKGALSAGLSAKVHIYAGLESKAEFTFEEDDFVQSVYLAGTLSLPEGVSSVLSGTISAYSDESYTSPIGTASVPPGDGSWLIPIPLADIPEGLVYLKAEVTGSDGETYVAMGSTTDAVPEKGVQGIVLVSDTTAPGEVSSLSGIFINRQAHLNWTDPADEDRDHIEISWTSDEGESGNCSQPCYQYSRVNSITIEEGLTDGTAYIFTLKAVDKAGNKSEGIHITPKTLEDIVSIAIEKATTPPRFKEDYVATEISDVTGLDLTGLTVRANFGGVGGWDSSLTSRMVRGAPGTYLSLTAGNDFATAGSKTITVTINGKTATFQVEVHNGQVIKEVTVDLPSREDGVVEQLFAGTTFYGPGAVFTATVSGYNPGSWVLKTVTWTFEDQNLDPGTTIDGAGRLTVAPADHGKLVTVKATSTFDPTKSGTKRVTLVSVLPSALYGTWSYSDDYDVITTMVISATGFTGDDSQGNSYRGVLRNCEPAVNQNSQSKGEYPVGYQLTDQAVNYVGGWELHNPTLFLSKDGEKYQYRVDYSSLNNGVFTKQ